MEKNIRDVYVVENYLNYLKKEVNASTEKDVVDVNIAVARIYAYMANKKHFVKFVEEHKYVNMVSVNISANIAKGQVFVNIKRINIDVKFVSVLEFVVIIGKKISVKTVEMDIYAYIKKININVLIATRNVHASNAEAC